MIEQTAQGLVLKVKIIPKSSTNKIVGWENEELKIRIAAPPEKGKANLTLIRFLSKFLGLTQAEVVLLSGEASRHKRILLVQADYQKISSVLLDKYQ